NHKSMKNLFLKNPVYGLFLATMMMTYQGMGQGIVSSLSLQSYASEQPEKVSTLQSVLQNLQGKYNVYLNYEVNVVKGKMVNTERLQQARSIEESLEQVLTPLNLGYEKLKENYYVIFIKDEKSQPQ